MWPKKKKKRKVFLSHFSPPPPHSLPMPVSTSYLASERDKQPSQLPFDPFVLWGQAKHPIEVGERPERLSNLPQVTQQASRRARMQSSKIPRTGLLSLSTFDRDQVILGEWGFLLCIVALLYLAAAGGIHDCD